MADANFVVNVVMNLINKRSNQMLKNLEAELSKMRKIEKQIVSDKLNQDKITKSSIQQSIQKEKLSQSELLTLEKKTKLELVNLRLQEKQSKIIQQKETKRINDLEYQKKIEDLTQNIIDKSTSATTRADTNTISEKEKSINSLQKSMKLGFLTSEQFEESMKKAGISVLESGKFYDKSTMKIIDLKKAQKLVIDNNRRMDFGFLSLIFGGMALTRTFGGFTRAVKESYMSLADENDIFAKKINGLSGAFEYLKYTIFDAFGNSFIGSVFLDGLTKITIWASEMISDSPALGVALVVIAGGLTAIGTAMTFLGQLITLKLALLALGGTPVLSGLAKVGAGISQIGKDATNSTTLLSKAASAAVGITVAVVSGIRFAESIKEGDVAKSIGFGVAGIIGTVGAVTAIFNPAIGLTIGVLGGILFKITDMSTDIAGSLSQDKIREQILKEAGFDNKTRGGKYIQDPIELGVAFQAEQILALEDKVLNIRNQQLSASGNEFNLLREKEKQLNSLIREETKRGNLAYDNFMTELEFARETKDLVLTKLEIERYARNEQELSTLEKEKELEITRETNKELTKAITYQERLNNLVSSRTGRSALEARQQSISSGGTVYTSEGVYKNGVLITPYAR